jgi:hypothetical protein
MATNEAYLDNLYGLATSCNMESRISSFEMIMMAACLLP